MTGKLYIDSTDAFSAYGVYVIDGGWNELLAMPPLKAVNSTDWQEYDGVEADLSHPVLNSREVTVKFAIRGTVSNFYSFLDALQDGAVHDFNCVEIGRTFHLRMVSYSSVELYQLLGFFAVKFADDYPMEGYTHLPPKGDEIEANDEYKVDLIPMSVYGVRVLNGTLSEIVKPGQTKQAMLRNIASRTGAIYDTQGEVTFKTKDTKLKCLLRASSLANMWRNYYGLLWQIIQPDLHSLYVRRLKSRFDAFQFYYKSCQVSHFGTDANGRIWLEFTLTLTFNGDYHTQKAIPPLRIAAVKQLRLTEAEKMRITE